MRISDLSRESGVPIPTVKFYLREGLLPPGHRTARNQATYDERHLRRLRLVRTLAEVGGLSLDSIRRVLDALAQKDSPLHEVLAVAHTALRRDEGPSDPALPAARSEIDTWLKGREWRLAPGTPAADDVAGTLLALRRLGWDVGPEVFDRYAEHAHAIAEAEIAYVAGTSDPESAVEATVIGTVLFERALSSLRLLAQEHHSRIRLGAGHVPSKREPGSMSRSVAQKMGIKEGARALFVNAPALALKAIELPELEVSEDLDGDFDYIHLFSITQAEMDETFAKLKPHLRASGMLWLSWPKARKLGSDLGLPKVIEIGYNHGLVESTCLRIDDTWSGLKFTHPMKGKVYQNSYGTLPDA